MNILVITVAGRASRFNKDLRKQTLKCIYTEKTLRECLLYQIMTKSDEVDKFIIVGGYLFAKLKDVLMNAEEFSEFRSRVILVENPYFSEYGSGYSLYVGLKEAIKFNPDSIIFAEGDLYTDKGSYEKVLYSNKSVITITNETIYANKSVVFYKDLYGHIHYLYDQTHEALSIEEPFRAIFNSGQIWKFVNVNMLTKIVSELTEQEYKDTNLVIIQKYFEQLQENEIDIVKIDKWFNCNTVKDYRKTGIIEKEESR